MRGLFRTKIQQFVSWGRLFKRAYGGYKKQIVALTVLGFLSGILEGVGVNALIPLFSFFSGGDGGDDFISQAIRGFFSLINIPFTLPWLLVFISLLFFFKAFALLCFQYIRTTIRSDYEQETRSSLFRETLFSGWPYLLKQKLGFLETVLLIDTARSAKLFGIISEMIMIATGLLMYLFVAINISWPATTITLGVGAFLFLVLKPLVRRARSVGKETAQTNKEVSHVVNESVLGMKTIKSLSLEHPFSAMADVHFEHLRDLEVRTTMLGILSTIFVQPISVLFICGVFAYSYYYTGGFNFGVLAALMYLIQRMFTYMQLLQSNVHSVGNLAPHLQEVLLYKDQAKAYQEPGRSKGEPFSFHETFSFESVTFGYDPETPVIRDITFSVHRGDMVGLIGLSGAGKTTIFDLILRLFLPTRGKISVDGKDAESLSLKDWREKLGYVSQDLFLKNDTVANNISFFASDVRREDVIEAARMAHSADFIETLPQGYDTMVGERGLRLSAGQRQRIAIARALVRKPEILLLDEATSALDNESEANVQRVIEELKGRMTILVIAHRLSTVMRSDKLLVLQDGAITEEGTPDELLKDKESYFYKMHNIRK